MRRAKGSGRLPRIGRGLFKVGFAVVLLGLALEATSRLSLFGPAGLDLRRVPVTSGLTPSRMRVSKNRSWIPSYRPNLDVFANTVRFQTNSRGLRDAEYPVAKPPDTLRVAVIGSSYAVPSGVEIEHAFHSVLEERLNAGPSPMRYEFINFAIAAAGPSMTLAKLRHHVLPYEPDLILNSVTLTALPYLLLEWEGGPDRLPPEYRWPPPGLLAHGDRLRATGLRSYFLIQMQRRLAPAKPMQPPMQPPPTGPDPRDVVWRLGEFSRAHAIPVVILRLEYEPDTPSEVEQRFAARVAQERMHLLDTRDAFRGTTARDFWVNGLDRHPNASAHAIFADELEAFLRRHQLLGP